VSRSLLSLRRERAAGLWPHELAALALLLGAVRQAVSLGDARRAASHELARSQVYDERIGEFGRCVIEEVRTLVWRIEPYGFRAA